MEDATPVPSGLAACSWAWDCFGCGVCVPQSNGVPAAVHQGSLTSISLWPEATVLSIARGAMDSPGQPMIVSHSDHHVQPPLSRGTLSQHLQKSFVSSRGA